MGWAILALKAPPGPAGKAALYHEFARIDAVTVILDVHEADEIVDIVQAIVPAYALILKDICCTAPLCY